ncbi:MAG TPA: nuclear transport factor 2 family protein [Pyrinomonadaceae bacterium]
MRRLSSLLLSMLLLFSAAICQTEKRSPALASLLAAERAFARTSVEKGIRESFLAFFADDGINFQPHPVKTRETILKRPAPSVLPPVVLNWEPAYADVSSAGDLGYTTGPYVFTDVSPPQKPPHYGFYFSVWKKQAGGTWKVVVDAGIDTPDHSTQKFPLKTASPSKWKSAAAKLNRESERASLMNLDREFLQAANARGLVTAFLEYLGDEVRLHRDGNLPFIGRDGIRSFLLQKPVEMSWQPISSDVSQSHDLGYTYGSYDLKYVGTNESEKGYYVRVWKRNKRGGWKIVLDTLSPIPPEKG